MKINFQRYGLFFLLNFFLFIASSNIYAMTFNLSGSIIGGVQYISAYNESTVSLAQRYNLGVNSIINANPGLSEGGYSGGRGTLTIPTAFILPPVAHKGIVINLPEMRLYYFPGNNVVMTYPIGIGRIGKTIPVTTTSVARKVVNPVWIPTPDIREYNLQQGIDLPYAMPPGPDNPLGPYAIYLRVPTFLIHSTIFPESIGKRASFGCIRMNESDIREFFPLVSPGTQVCIINVPVKIAWAGNRLYMQAYPALVEKGRPSWNSVVKLIQNHISDKGSTFVNWQVVSYLLEQPDGVPRQIGYRKTK